MTTNDVFAEAKRAQSKLDALELKRRAIIDGLSTEAAVMLDALDAHRANQTIDSTPTNEAPAQD